SSPTLGSSSCGPSAASFARSIRPSVESDGWSSRSLMVPVPRGWTDEARKFETAGRTPLDAMMAAVPIPFMAARIRIGTQGWNYDDWIGTFYPARTKPADFLGVYARAF